MAGRPLVLDDVQAQGAIAVHIGVVDLCNRRRQQQQQGQQQDQLQEEILYNVGVGGGSLHRRQQQGQQPAGSVSGRGTQAAAPAGPAAGMASGRDTAAAHLCSSSGSGGGRAGAGRRQQSRATRAPCAFHPPTLAHGQGPRCPLPAAEHGVSSTGPRQGGGTKEDSKKITGPPPPPDLRLSPHQATIGSPEAPHHPPAHQACAGPKSGPPLLHPCLCLAPPPPRAPEVNRTRGGFSGYCSLKVMRSWKTPPSLHPASIKHTARYATLHPAGTPQMALARA